MDTFKCCMCKGVFEKAWTDEEALAEAADNFAGEIPEDQREVVCDVCFEKMQKILPVEEFMREFN